MAPRKDSSDNWNRSYFRRKDIFIPNMDNNYQYIAKLKLSFDANQKELRKQLQSITAKARSYTVAETQTDIDLEMQEDDRSLESEPGAVRKRCMKLLSLNKLLDERNKKLVEECKNLEENLQTENKANLEKLKKDDEEERKSILANYDAQLAKQEEYCKAEIKEKDSLLKKLQLEIQVLNEQIDSLEKNIRKAKGDILKLEAENRILFDENKALERHLQMTKLELNSHYKEAAYIESLTRKCAESEKTKQLLLENFCKLEEERDQLAAFVQKNMKSVRKSNEEKAAKLLERITKFENQLDVYELS